MSGLSHPPLPQPFGHDRSVCRSSRPPAVISIVVGVLLTIFRRVSPNQKQEWFGVGVYGTKDGGPLTSKEHFSRAVAPEGETATALQQRRIFSFANLEAAATEDRDTPGVMSPFSDEAGGDLGGERGESGAAAGGAWSPASGPATPPAWGPAGRDRRSSRRDRPGP